MNIEDIQQAVRDRLAVVISALQKIPDSYNASSASTTAQFQEYCAATVSMGNEVYGQDSVQMRELLSAVEGLRSINRTPGVMDGKIAKVLIGFMKNLQSEIESGLLSNIATRVAGEVLGDFLDLADSAFSANEKDVAAVLASAALEDALKRVAIKNEIDVDDKDMSEVINALKAGGVVKGPQAKIVQSYVKLRNKAFHADWEKIDKESVNSLIGFTEQFLLTHFS